MGLQTGEVLGAPQRIVERVVQINAERQREMAERIIRSCGGDVQGKRIGILGVAFKPNTDDVREAPALTIIPVLQGAGATVTAFDPIAMEQAQKHLKDVIWCQDAYEVAKDYDAIAIVTEWNEFRALDLKRVGDSMRAKRLLDMRNIYKPEEIEGTGFHYMSIGRPDVEPAPRDKIRTVSSA